MNIREITQDDWQQVWPIFSQVVRAGDTYGYETDTSETEAIKLWLKKPAATFVCEEDGKILATYYIKNNHDGPGKHVCNCGYMVSSQARGRGLATAMCEHSQSQARVMGYKAMQFNFVASSNETAVRLWNKLGFDTVGRLPGAFNHPALGYVDALVMFKRLD